MYRRSLAVLVLCISALFAVPMLAQADTGDIIEGQNTPPTAADGWQAGTCTSDTVPGRCTPMTTEQFFKTAGGHPPVGFTQYTVQHTVEQLEVAPGVIIELNPLVEPLAGRDVKTLRVDLPPGLTVNPQATAGQCSQAEFFHSPAAGIFIPECKPGTKTGEEQASLVVNKAGFELEPGKPLPKGAKIPLIPGLFKVDVFNLQPDEGEPALFGFVIADKEPILLRTEVSWESDYHESFTVTFPVESKDAGVQTLISRLINFGQSGNGTFITNPTTCFDPEAAAFGHLYSTWFRAQSFEVLNPTFPTGSSEFEAVLPTGVHQEGCEDIPFDPSIAVAPGTNNVDSPSPTTVTTTIPFEDPSKGGSNISQAQLRKAVVKLPDGMGLNPSGAKGLVACTTAQFAKGERVLNNTCPADSKIGSVEIETPPLPAGSLKGDVFVGEQKSSNPTSGEEFRILVEAKSKAFGVVVRLVGNVSADPVTGKLTTTFDDQEVGPLAGPLPKGLPQVPFESVKIKFDGAKSVLTSPPTCAKAITTSTMEPWSTPASTKSPSNEFELTSDPGGGSCPKTLAQRKFTPAYTAKSDSTAAGAFSPFRVHIGRVDGQQELKRVDALLPKGVTGKLVGIPYCPEAAIKAAEGQSGKAEQAKPSCPGASLVGSTSTTSGSGSDPVQLPGKVYLAGPYKGAALSLVVATPAIQGPFDLGTVVVRVALAVDPISAQIHAISDVIPDVFGGVKLDLRAIDFNMDRSQFTLNPTNCNPGATTGNLAGGGSDPASPAAFSSFAFNTAYQATDCSKLGFKPRLRVKLFGPTTRAHYPRLQATLTARPGDANVGRTALTLPHALFLEQGHIGTVCTNPKLAAHTCPADSVYGTAEAVSPLLDQPLRGPVYLVPSGHELPDLVADLQGQVEIQLHGTVGSKHGGLRTVFESVPDVPVTKFVLNMRGGKKSLLVNSTNTCKGKQRAVLSIGGQNGKTVNNKKFPLDIVSCAKKKAHKHGKRHGKKHGHKH